VSGLKKCLVFVSQKTKFQRKLETSQFGVLKISCKFTCFSYQATEYIHRIAICCVSVGWMKYLAIKSRKPISVQNYKSSRVAATFRGNNRQCTALMHCDGSQLHIGIFKEIVSTNATISNQSANFCRKYISRNSDSRHTQT